MCSQRAPMSMRRVLGFEIISIPPGSDSARHVPGGQNLSWDWTSRIYLLPHNKVIYRVYISTHHTYQLGGESVRVIPVMRDNCLMDDRLDFLFSVVDSSTDTQPSMGMAVG